MYGNHEMINFTFEFTDLPHGKKVSFVATKYEVIVEGLKLCLKYC